MRNKQPCLEKGLFFIGGKKTTYKRGQIRPFRPKRVNLLLVTHKWDFMIKIFYFAKPFLQRCLISPKNDKRSLVTAILY